MCNRYRNDPEALKTLPTWREYILWSLSPPAAEPQFEMFPRYQGQVVRTEGGARIIDTMQWGVPMTMPGKRPGTTVTKRITNVRNLTSPFWRSMLNTPAQRCLVPFTIFAEPMIGMGRENHWFTVPSEPVSAFAGIWRPTVEGNAYAFLTCDPNPLVAPLHPKAMPVILHPEDYDRWLDGTDAAELAVAFPSQLMGMV